MQTEKKKWLLMAKVFSQTCSETLRVDVVHDNSIIIATGEYFRIVIIECQTKDIAVMLIFHDTRFRNASYGFFQFPQ